MNSFNKSIISKTASVVNRRIFPQTAAQNALQAGGKFIPWQLATVPCDGKLLE